MHLNVSSNKKNYHTPNTLPVTNKQKCELKQVENIRFPLNLKINVNPQNVL